MEKSRTEKSPFTQINQVGVVVRDMDKAIERLASLGIGPFQPKLLPPNTKEWFRGKPLKAKLNIRSTMMGDTELELVQPIEGDSPHQEFLDSKGEGIQHIAVRVDDVEKSLEKLKGKGLRVIDEKPRLGAGGASIAFFHPKSSGGVLLEICQPAS